MTLFYRYIPAVYFGSWFFVLFFQIYITNLASGLNYIANVQIGRRFMQTYAYTHTITPSPLSFLQRNKYRGISIIVIIITTSFFFVILTLLLLLLLLLHYVYALFVGGISGLCQHGLTRSGLADRPSKEFIPCTKANICISFCAHNLLFVGGIGGLCQHGLTRSGLAGRTSKEFIPCKKANFILMC